MENSEWICCPCCGFKTLSERGGYEICPVCFWEDDLYQSDNPDYKGGANKMSLNQTKKNFAEWGACDKDMLFYVRKPLDDEL